MIESNVRQIKLLLLFLIDLLFRIHKYVKYKWTGKHEVERICESQTDIYEKTMQLDQWLARTKCHAICQFLERNFDRQSEDTYPRQALRKILTSCRRHESSQAKKRKDKSLSNKFSRISYLEEGDTILNDVITTLSNDLLDIIKKQKCLDRNSRCQNILQDSLYRIISYRTSLFVSEELAATKYDASVGAHTDKLLSFWNHLVKADKNKSIHDDDDDEPINLKAFPMELSSEIDDKSNIISKRWSHVGFQGEDPGTDFRGMGLLGLIQLEYLSRKPKKLARDLLKRSLNDEHSYPFAIVGINITFNLLNLFKDGSMKHLYYDTGDILFRNNRRILKLLTTFNDIYVELFLRFDCFWHDSKPETIFEFKGLMEKFINIIRMDLYNRNFSLKFIY